MQATSTQFIDHAIPASAEYVAAEVALTKAWDLRLGENDPKLLRAQKHAVRKASEAAIALSSLVDRAAAELSMSKEDVLREVQSECIWPSGPMRERAAYRVRSVADAYKHHTLDPKRHDIVSAEDVLACGDSFGSDGYSVGKFSGVEVMARESASGREWKFLGDLHVVLRAWQKFLQRRGVDASAVEIPV